MAELVDAPDSKSGFRKEVRVRFSLPAPIDSETCASFWVTRFSPSSVMYLSDSVRAAFSDSSAENLSAARPFSLWRLRYNNLSYFPDRANSKKACCGRVNVYIVPGGCQNMPRMRRGVGRLICWLGWHDFYVIDASFGFGAVGSVEKVKCRRCGVTITRQA